MHHYFVSYSVDFFRTRRVCAMNAEEAAEIATELEMKHQKALRRNGYVIGDIDVVESSREGESTGLYRSSYVRKTPVEPEPRLEDVR